MKLKYFCHRDLFINAYATPFKILKDHFEEEAFHNPFNIIPVDFSSFYSLIDQYGFEVAQSKIASIISEKISTIKSFYDNQIIAIMAVTCADDNLDWQKIFDYVYQEFHKHFPNKVVLIHPFKNISNYIYQNLYFNYTKAFYTSFKKLDLHNTNDGSYTTEKNFIINPIKPKDITMSKIFLCANRILYDDNKNPIVSSPKLRLRLKLLQLLRGKDGFLSDFENDIILPGQTDSSTEYLHRVRGNGTWIPVHSDLYDRSYISIFIETTVTSGQKLITEKTYDPLIKGHFILPFGYSGIIQDLKSMGFIFPNWIDYSYDAIEDTNTRFHVFRKEIKRLLDLPKPSIDNHHIRDIDMLKHNQKLFFTKPYEVFNLC